jgi:hypothetical protein
LRLFEDLLSSRILERSISPCRETIEDTTKWRDVFDHVNENGDAAATWQDDIEKSRPIAELNCSVFTCGECKQRFGRYRSLDAPT